MALWVVAASALIVALLAWFHARRTARQLAHITELYWQLKFDYGELKAKVEPSSPPSAVPSQSFIPLTHVKR